MRVLVVFLVQLGGDGSCNNGCFCAVGIFVAGKIATTFDATLRRT